MNRTRVIALTAFVIGNAAFIALMATYLIWFFHTFTGGLYLWDRRTLPDGTTGYTADTRLTVSGLSCVESSDGHAVIAGTLTNTGEYRAMLTSVIIRASAAGGDMVGTYGNYWAPKLYPGETDDFEIDKPAISRSERCDVEIWASGRQIVAYGQLSAAVSHE